MDNLYELINDIEKLRKDLHELIYQKNNDEDPEIVSASEKLNNAITQYAKIVGKKVNN